jgi:DNA-binding Lrp family transcriptional regulator
MMPNIQLNPADKAILEQLEKEGQSVPARLAEQTDYDRQYVHKRLRRLDEHDIVEALSHGLYRFKNWPENSNYHDG